MHPASEGVSLKRKLSEIVDAAAKDTKESRVKALQSIDHLPPEIIVKVLRHLRLQTSFVVMYLMSHKDVLRLAETCTTMNQISKDPHLRFKLQLSVNKPLATQTSAVQRLGPQVVSLTCAGLRKLNDISFLRSTPNLTHLDMSDVSGLSGRALLEIATLSTLDTLILRAFHRAVTATEMRALVLGCPQLRHLDMCNASLLMDADMRPLPDLKCLETLELAGTKVGIFPALLDCPALMSINLNGSAAATSSPRFAYADSSPPALKEFRALHTRLHIYEVSMLLQNSYSSLVSLHIDVRECQSLLPHLTIHATSLTSLNMSGSDVKDNELQPLLEARGNALRFLSLCGTPITGQCFTAFVAGGHECPYLRCAMFSQSRISELQEACEALLSVSPAMEYFEVQSARSVGRNARRRWAEQYPNKGFKADLTWGADI